jgi:predicted ATPase
MNGTPNGRVRTMTALLSSERFNPPSASDHFLRHNLPPATASCIGREDEFDAVRQLLNEPDIRLVTLLGPGGIGKTRLALELGHHLVNERGALATNSDIMANSRTVETTFAFMDGVLFVPLAPVRQPTPLVQAIADGIGFRFHQRTDPTQQLIDFFRDKTLLLILDNCEHLLREFRLITRLMDAAPGLKVLATSRERLNLSHEFVFALEGMDVPDWWSTEEALQMSAMQLFEQAATRIRPAFRLGPDDLLPVARICQMVQGMPLGLELAAAWVDALSPDEIADRLSLSLNLMQSSLPRERERHHSMRAVFDMSWERLNSTEREAFMRLSAFAGGFTRDMAATIARANLRTLTSLTDKALLQRLPDGRFVMHELLQQYAAERLALSDEHDALFDRHSNIFLEFVRVHEPALHGRGQLRALETIRAEIHNIRSAWNWALSQKKTDLIGAALSAIHLFCEIAGAERAGVAAFQDATQALKMERLQGPSGLVIARLLSRMAHLMNAISPQDAEGMREEALEALHDLNAPADELAFLYSTWDGIPEQIQERREEGLALYRQLEDEPGQVRALLHLGTFYHRQREDYDRALTLLEACLALAQQIGNTYFEGLARFQLGWLKRGLGRLEESLEHYQAALGILARFKRHRLEADTYHNMSLIAIELDNIAQAEEHIRQSLAIHREIGNRFNIFAALDTLGTLKYNLGQYGAALKYYYEARDVVTELQNPHSSSFISKQLGFVYLAMGETRTARMHFISALRQGIYYSIPGVMVDSLVGIAILLAHDGQRERALELLAVTADQSASGKHEADEQRLVDELHQEFSDDVFYAVWQIGQAQEMEMVITELLAELEEEG